MKNRYAMGIACIIISMTQTLGMILAFNNQLPEWIFYSTLVSGIGIYPLMFIQLRSLYKENVQLNIQNIQLVKSNLDQLRNARIHSRELPREF